MTDENNCLVVLGMPATFDMNQISRYKKYIRSNHNFLCLLFTFSLPPQAVNNGDDAFGINY